MIDMVRSAPRLSLAALLWLAACSGPQQLGTGGVPTWSTAAVDYGQGQIVLGLRYRWVAERDSAGVVIRTPEGGEALVRVFSCGRPRSAVEQSIRDRLRARLQGNEIARHGDRVISLRYWQGKEIGGSVKTAAVVLHGPLLISFSSANLEAADLVGAAQRVRLSLPVATISGCFPLCDIEETKCVPQSSEDEGTK